MVVTDYFLSTYYVPVIETLNGRKYYLVQWFLNFEQASDHLRGLLKHKLQAPPPEFWIQWDWDGP